MAITSIGQYANGDRLKSRIDLHRRFGTNPMLWHEWVYSRLPITQSSRVLEVGCGTGALWATNFHRIPRDAYVVLSDRSPGMIKSTLKSLERASWRPVLHAADAQAIPHDSRSFDIVIANHMLYHVDSIEQALLEMARVLRVDGTLVASTNGHRHVQELTDLAVKCGLPAAKVSDPSRFGLDTGWNHLGRHFKQINLDYYNDTLNVTDSLAASQFVISAQEGRVAVPTAMRLRELVEFKIRAEGRIPVTAEAGMFRCSGVR